MPLRRTRGAADPRARTAVAREAPPGASCRTPPMMYSHAPWYSGSASPARPARSASTALRASLNPAAYRRVAACSRVSGSSSGGSGSHSVRTQQQAQQHGALPSRGERGHAHTSTPPETSRAGPRAPPSKRAMPATARSQVPGTASHVPSRRAGNHKAQQRSPRRSEGESCSHDINEVSCDHSTPFVKCFLGRTLVT